MSFRILFSASFLLLLGTSCKKSGDCEVRDITVDVGNCTSEETYNLSIDFIYENPGNQFFDLYIRNDVLIGYYPLDQLPITIENFPLSGNEHDFIKICINDNPDCCEIIEFLPPNCQEDNDCEVRDITVDVGDCTSEETYNLSIDFIYENPGNQFFDLYVRNDVLIGYYPLDQLPVTIENFPLSGNEHDFIKICINDNPDCCEIIEFLPPNCQEQSECDVRDITVDVGDCTSEETYNLSIDFIYENPGNQFFDLYIRNDVLIGYYPLDQLPITIENFPLSGNEYDFIKICINDNPDCCEIIEFLPPNCQEQSECDVRDITVDIGECTSEETYNLTVDFIYENPGNQFFDLYIRNDVLIGYYPLDQLPITIENFPLSGNEYDFIKICINDNPDCCEAIEFLPPDC